MNRRVASVCLVVTICAVGFVLVRRPPAALSKQGYSRRPDAAGNRLDPDASQPDDAKTLREKTRGASQPDKAGNLVGDRGVGMPARSESSPSDAQNSAEGRRPLVSATASAHQSRITTGAMTRLPSRAARFRQQFERDLGLFFETVQVDDATRDRLSQAKVDALLEHYDIIQVAHEQGLSMEEASKLRKEVTRKYSNTVVDILGPDVGRYFMDVGASARFMPIADDFAARCLAQGEPLTPAAKAAVAINLMKNLEDSNHPRPSTAVAWWENEAFTAAEKVLTPGQLGLFKKLWAEHPYPKLPQ